MAGIEAENVVMEGAEAEDAEMEETIAWSIRDLYHGLVPQDLVKGLKQFFCASTWIAQYMVDRLVSVIEEYGRTEIWNSRCNALLPGKNQSASQPGERRTGLVLGTTISTH